MSLNQALSLATHLDAIDSLRLFFVFAACSTLTVSFPAPLRTRFIIYGPRASPAEEKGGEKHEAQSTPVRVLDSLASLRVPHGYFTQFYIASLLSSAFWGFQIVFNGPAFRAIASRIHPEHLQTSMSVEQVKLCWTLVVIQGIRRLYECLSFSKPSSSKMWFVHWVLGLGFYLATAVAIWIEGTGALLSYEPTLEDVRITNAPTLRTFLCVPVFLIASGLQHDCHHYLFSLEKYTVPTHPLFSRIVCPHYTAECVIYLSLAVLAAPEGETVNKTLASCFCFVAVNLGITAATSKQWYKAKFGEAAVQGKWKMIPWVF